MDQGGAVIPRSRGGPVMRRRMVISLIRSLAGRRSTTGGTGWSGDVGVELNMGVHGRRYALSRVLVSSSRRKLLPV